MAWALAAKPLPAEICWEDRRIHPNLPRSALVAFSSYSAGAQCARSQTAVYSASGTAWVGGPGPGLSATPCEQHGLCKWCPLFASLVEKEPTPSRQRDRAPELCRLHPPSSLLPSQTTCPLLGLLLATPLARRPPVLPGRRRAPRASLLGSCHDVIHRVTYDMTSREENSSLGTFHACAAHLPPPTRRSRRGGLPALAASAAASSG